VIGALGIGRARDSVIGSVCERVARHSDRDVWVVKHVPEPGEADRDTILVGVDGSPQSFGALMTAIDLARTFGKKVEAIAVYDPYLHYSVFNGIVNVLTEQAAKVFRFEEQNQLHEEIIDTGLAQIYQSHLEIGERMGNEAGVDVKKTLLDGKPFQKILDLARKTSPWLIVLGRIGVHSPKDETGLGSNAENVLRAAPCDVLLSTRLEVPRLDVRAEETVRWTPEAEERMKHVPEQVKGIARTGVLRLALERGHSVITSAVIDDAMDRFMPKSASNATKALAEAVALERAKAGPVSMCRACGVAATESDAVRCTVCGATDFEVISREMIEKIAAVEGGLEEETTYDGRKLRWSEDARKGLWTMKNAYQRRRVKARVEKRARMMKLDAITLEFARQVIEDETGTPLEIGAGSTRSVSEGAGTGPKLVARDDKKNPLISAYDWTNEAVQRILRVPAGFMRNQTQERIEALAAERAAARRPEASGEGGTTIDLALVEEGIEIGKTMMAEMIANYPAPGAGTGAAKAAHAAAGAPAVPAADGRGYLNEVSPLTQRDS
jgi:nucleotide-binding universal stress UspA family protein